MMKTGLLLVAVVGIVIVASGVANADTRTVGIPLKYEMIVLDKHQAPPGMPKEAVEIYLKNYDKPQSFKFSVVIDRVDANGSAHATISSHLDMPKIPFGHFPNMDASFEGSVLPDGQIVPMYDASTAMATIQKFQSTRGHIYDPSAEEKSNLAAYGLSDKLSLFDDVALGAGKRKVFKDGDTWRIVVADKNNELVNFVSTGTQSYRGHDVVTLTVTAVQTTDKGLRNTNGTAYYDPQQNLVIGLHVVVVGGDMGPGTDMSQTTVIQRTIDINLQQ